MKTSVLERTAARLPRPKKAAPERAEGRCVCGAVRLEIDVPAVWAWHDHSARSRHAQGCAYATYLGSWRSRFRILEGEESIARFEDKDARTSAPRRRKWSTSRARSSRRGRAASRATT
jgi:hypothetical protein